MSPLLLSRLATPKAIAIMVWVGIVIALYTRGNIYHSKLTTEQGKVQKLTDAIHAAQIERDMLALKLQTAATLASSTNAEHKEEARRILAEPIPTNPVYIPGYVDGLLKRLPR